MQTLITVTYFHRLFHRNVSTVQLREVRDYHRNLLPAGTQAGAQEGSTTPASSTDYQDGAERDDDNDDGGADAQSDDSELLLFDHPDGAAYIFSKPEKGERPADSHGTSVRLRHACHVLPRPLALYPRLCLRKNCGDAVVICHACRPICACVSGRLLFLISAGLLDAVVDAQTNGTSEDAEDWRSTWSVQG